MSDMSRLILVGYGGFGREVAAWIGAAGMPYDVVGHIDDEKLDQPAVLGPIQGHRPRTDVAYVTCFGDGSDRHAVRCELEAAGARMGTVVAPSVIYVTSPTASKNSLFLGVCSISNDIVLGDDLLIQSFACIGHDVSIGTGVTIGAHAFIGGNARLEPFCTIHPHAVVLPHVTIGKGAVVGAGTVVIKDVPPGTTVFGVPAKIIVPGNT
ncbi:MAG: acetyltransferase [Dokdonella sp.]|uniref:acetyltransferase n=1 Tax=Dokdonella sp. TaxID=2291710 RepID=UPI0025B9E905|nr:acetyltransferase [Dokdonella sp.]MBZ0224259.1 acetyltransferase [Dokdonella sp.]